jgi:Uma2 family endonuclease
MPKPIVGSSALKKETYTVADWLKWGDEERWELIHGVAYAMSPAPKLRHQGIVVNLINELATFLKGKPGEPFVAPVDVFLPGVEPGNEEEADTVVQPDVVVVCDPVKLRENGIHGAPDFVAEILSDSTAMKDLSVKKKLYEENGVHEYWIVSPEDGSVFAYRLESGRFGLVREYRREDPVESTALPGFVWPARGLS